MGVSALAAPAKERSKELYWFLAASMVKPGKEIVSEFNRENMSFKVLLIPGGSGELLSKIMVSGQGDLYTPASRYFLERAIKAGIVKNYVKLLVQIPVLGLSKNIAHKKPSFKDIVAGNYKLAVGNPKTMALGETYVKIKKKMGKKIAAQIKRNERIYAISVSQVVNYIESGAVDAGTIYDSVARADNITYVSIPDNYNIPEYAYLVTLKNCANQKEVEIFKEFILNHKKSFEKYGFNLAK